jgi:hypothetical protein
LVPVIEALDLKSLKSAAAKVSPEAVAMVVSEAPWNPVAKTALISSGSAVSAKWLNHFGISAENAPEVTLGLALVSILGGRFMLMRQLTELAAERRARDAQQPKKEISNAPTPTN